VLAYPNANPISANLIHGASIELFPTTETTFILSFCNPYTNHNL